MLTVAAHDTAGQFVWLWHIYLALTVAVGLLVTAAIVLVAVRYRRRPGRPPRRDPDSAPRVEAVYLLVIAAVVVGLLGATYRTENREDALTAHPAVRVQVTASQWQWQFSYPALHITDVAHNIGSRHPRFARLVVPAGRPRLPFLRPLLPPRR